MRSGDCRAGHCATRTKSAYFSSDSARTPGGNAQGHCFYRREFPSLRAQSDIASHETTSTRARNAEKVLG